MKITGPKPKPLFLLAVMALLALSPALCLANNRHHDTPGQTQVLQQTVIDFHSLEAGLRTGRLTSTSPWRTISKKDPELMDLTQKIFRIKARLTMGTCLSHPASLPIYPPPFLVLRI